MSKLILVLAEKPAVGKALAAWLSKTMGHKQVPVGRSHIEVGPYRVSWLFGHVLENAMPHVYNEKYKRWVMADLPFMPPEWILLPKSTAADQIKMLKKLLTEASEVIGLGDPDQEGQLLQDEFLLWAKNKAPVKRLWLAATDDASIAKAWAAIKPNSDYEGYYWSALARSHGDFLYGINGTRACTLASQSNGGNATLNVGRVQTPTLGLVVALEQKIRTFKPVNYFTPFIRLASVPEFRANWAPNKDTDPRLDSEGRLLDKTVADAIVGACLKDASALVTQVTATKGKEQAPLPFSLSTLQEHMSRRFSMGVQDVLKVAQSLYEKKVATYPRTDSEYLPESQHAEAVSLITDGLWDVCSAQLGSAPKLADPTLKSRAFNDKKVTAHHAIVPRPITEAQFASLTVEERRLWLEIAKRYLLQFFPVAEFLSTEIELSCGSEPFRASGKVYTLRGWKDAFTSDKGADEDEDPAPTLPKVAKGDVLKLAAAALDKTTTKPPKRFTEGTLVAAMKNIHKYVADPKLKAILRENVGIGTEATRASIINELMEKFIVLDKKELKPTALGEQLINALPVQLTVPDMTALWQQDMDDIRKTGKAGYSAFIAKQEAHLRTLIAEVPSWFAGKKLTVAGKASKPTLETKATEHTCPTCGGELRHINGKFGWFFGCQNDKCKGMFKDVGGKPMPKAPPAPKSAVPVEIDGHKEGSSCPKCKKGTLLLRTCGPATRTPGKQFLSCSKFSETGKAKCGHSVWPK